MALKVGIPRSLYYYRYYPLWKTFFEELGAEVIVSDRTSKRILDEGVKSCVDEACLPVKVYHGHVINLRDRVDYLFIPRLTSVSKNEYICPKFGGLPDMIRHTLPGLPRIIDTEVNMRKNEKNSVKAALEVGSLFCDSRGKIMKAYRKAQQVYQTFKNDVKAGCLPDEEMCSRTASGGSHRLSSSHGRPLKIALIGHAYNLYDSYMNMRMLKKLSHSGIEVLTVDMVDEEVIKSKSHSLEKRMFWSFGREAVGSALHILDRTDIDGIIYIMSFGCGVDSFVCDLIERKVRRSSNTPFIVLTIDEHSGEAGLDTRLEAFMDMIKWRKKDEADISAYG